MARQIVGFAIGERSKATCLHLWESIPDDYKHCHTFSDFCHAYQHVFPAETHHGVGNETRETAHMERWNNTLRQRVGRYVRETLSFPNLMSIMTWLPSGLLFSIIWAYHLPSNHYRIGKYCN